MLCATGTHQNATRPRSIARMGCAPRHAAIPQRLLAACLSGCAPLAPAWPVHAGAGEPDNPEELVNRDSVNSPVNRRDSSSEAPGAGAGVARPAVTGGVTGKRPYPAMEHHDDNLLTTTDTMQVLVTPGTLTAATGSERRRGGPMVGRFHKPQF